MFLVLDVLDQNRLVVDALPGEGMLPFGLDTLQFQQMILVLTAIGEDVLLAFDDLVQHRNIPLFFH